MRKLLSVCLIASTVAILGCPKATALNNAQIVLDGLKAAAPIVERFLPAETQSVNDGVAAAQAIVDGIKAGNTTTPLAALTTLIPVFEKIVADISAIQNTPIQTEILASLAVVDIAVHVLVNVLTPAQVAAAPRADVLTRFRLEPVWGERFKH